MTCETAPEIFQAQLAAFEDMQLIGKKYRSLLYRNNI